MKISLNILLFFICVSSFAQDYYPKDYFGNPLDVTLVLSGSFAELRSNHFHSGLDLKTQQREGLKVYAAASGYVSRIKISHFGYGKAIYIKHPNGYTTVYAHLQRFSPEIEAYIKKIQYEKESFEVEVFPKTEDIILEKGEVIGFSGNTGGSGGPHLHFEIRDNNERPINPLLFGYDIKDTTLPVIKEVYAYPMDNNSYVNKSTEKQKLRLISLPNGDYTVENIQAYGTIGFAIESTDRQDLAYNNNGVYNIQSFFNGNKKIDIHFNRFSFDETRHLNRFIDYEHYKTKKERLQKLFIEPHNPLSLYNESDNQGFIKVEDSTASVYKVAVKDFKDNTAWLTINIEGKKEQDFKLKDSFVSSYFIHADKTNELLHKNISVEFYPDTFYDDFYMDFSVSNDTIILHKDIIPVKKHFKITYDISNYSPQDAEKLYIARLVGYKKYPWYSNTIKEKNLIYTITDDLGTYALVTDTVEPTIRAINFKDGQWLSKYRFLKLKIEDKGSGISNYRATVNGKWILMEYDYKTKTLVHDFNDNIITETKNNLKVIVTDNVGNNSTFETTFYRK
ncbi:M23 family metallopeptidase [Xanthomarina sp. F2636L]|uniref:M23 family metallopeptidase n=1 Tax=Xanthomarina sp. F2636L TaxID=2996018 RepID=UPI00225E033A|nr:M23 family metallopeptidase [Xanthomarina sp. F2636L]MCX7550437.1 M23 family metallopeptidase [Xanthomarina sp. F2636L]